VAATLLAVVLGDAPFEFGSTGIEFVGMYSMTDGTFFASEELLCHHHHTLAQAGAWNDWQSCLVSTVPCTLRWWFRAHGV